jgi:Rieske 2Fe-2S family protein
VASTAWALGCIQCYDDYVAVVRHTPRGVTATDVEIFWLVNADAKEGRDYKPERVMALWDITEREDRWIVENNQHGIRSGAYSSGYYATTEGGPSRFVQWKSRKTRSSLWGGTGHESSNLVVRDRAAAVHPPN